MGRPNQNKTLQDLDELLNLLLAHQDDFRKILLRGRFSSGQRRHTRGELAEMEGTPTVHYSDTTGDDAVWDETQDRTAKTISAMAQGFSKWLVITKAMMDMSDIDVKKRAKRTVPDCMACGDPCLERVRAGFDEKCYKRWIRNGRPDRFAFIQKTRKDKALPESPT